MNNNKHHIVYIFIILIGVAFISRLFYLQVIDTDFKQRAERYKTKVKRVDPYRGIIYDRYGRELVFNTPIFDVNVTRKDVNLEDTLSLCRLLNISKDEFIDRMDRVQNHPHERPWKPWIFAKQMDIEHYASIEDRFNYHGFSFNPRIMRDYPHSSLANTLGYIAEISAYELKKDTLNIYKQGDYIGKSGIETTYESYLHGRPGYEYIKVNAKGMEKGSYRNGEFDTLPVPGSNLRSGVDLELQEYGEKLMKNKIGSIVAIEPKTGEILAIVSSPSYDPKMLTGAQYSKNYSKLNKDTLKPLFDRANQAGYPPGSIFKLIQALIALQEGVVKTNTQLYCDGSLVGDHAPPGYYDIHKGIRLSSNNFFYRLFKMMIEQGEDPNQYVDAEKGFKKWREHVTSFGLGAPLNTDISHEKGGSVPSNELYDKWYGDKRWKASTIYSNAIGQGELLVVPMQMANLAAIIANRGHYYIPHVIKKIDGTTRGLDEFYEKHHTTVDSGYFKPVIDAMQDVVDRGTAARARIDGIEVCGKTGTIENPHGEDHSAFIAFAPKDDPKIAIATYVENAGYGGTWAAPISSLMIEKYLRGKVTNKWKEQRILDKKFIE